MLPIMRRSPHFPNCSKCSSDRARKRKTLLKRITNSTMCLACVATYQRERRERIALGTTPTTRERRLLAKPSAAIDTLCARVDSINRRVERLTDFRDTLAMAREPDSQPNPDAVTFTKSLDERFSALHERLDALPNLHGLNDRIDSAIATRLELALADHHNVSARRTAAAVAAATKPLRTRLDAAALATDIKRLDASIGKLNLALAAIQHALNLPRP